jgi:hypothetical protein
MKEETELKQTSKEEIVKALEELTRESGFMYSLAVASRHDLFLNPEESADINWRERLSFQEFSFLVGLMVKHPVDFTLPEDEKALMVQVHKMYELFEKLHKAHNDPLFKKLFEKAEQTLTKEEADKSYTDFFGSGDFMTEPIFYGGSGAYDFQYLEFAEKKYKKDQHWIIKNKGVDVGVMAKIAAHLKKLNEHKSMTSPKAESFANFCKITLDVFCFKQEDIDQFGNESAINFLSIFSLKPGSVNEGLNMPGAYNAADSHPIIKLRDNLYFLPVGFNLTQSIYESPFYWMSADTGYKDSASIHRGETTEEIAYEILISVFGKDNVYRGVKVLKNKKECITDIDVLAIAGNKAVIIQAKSKKLTELSRRGNEENLRADFKEAVQKAYDQGLICRNSVIGKNNALVTSDGKELHLNEFIDDAYIICLTSDHYPAVTHQVEVYLQKKTEDPYPLAMSIFDLDILVFYLKDPFEFLYYLRQRVDLSDYYKASSEIDLLACHLRQKLYPCPETDWELVDESFAQLIDANFPVMKGHVPKTSAVEKLHHKWKNERFQRLTEQVKSSRQPGFTDAIFYLYDLAGTGADDLINQMELTKEKTNRDGQQHDFSMIFEKGKSGVTFLSLPNSPDKIMRTLMPLAVARKYKTKADKWLALGSLAGSPNIVDAVAFKKQPWKEDAKLEELTKIALKRGIHMNLHGKKIGRNEPCYCGSGKKFKKCCGK